jgi:hypothetical protein
VCLQDAPLLQHMIPNLVSKVGCWLPITALGKGILYMSHVVSCTTAATCFVSRASDHMAANPSAV